MEETQCDMTGEMTHLEPQRSSHDDHQRAVREHALRLYCQGWRTYAIASALGVSERTARAALDAALDALDRELQADRGHWMLRALESFNAIAAAAWREYERHRAELPDECPADDGSPARPSIASASQCARYLALYLAAQREIARLQGLYAQAGQPPRDVRIILERREPGPENLPPPTSDA